MLKARMSKELYVEVPSGFGMLAQVASAVASSGVNIRALCAMEYEGKGHFWMVTDDNQKAGKAIRSFALKLEEREIVLLALSDKVGAAAELGTRLDKSGVNIEYLYAAPSVSGNISLMVFNSNDNHKVLEILNK